MTDSSYECLADLAPALSREGGSPSRQDEQPMPQDLSLPGAPLPAGT